MLVSLLNGGQFFFICREYFESIFGQGSVDDVRIMFHPETGRSRRFGFVTFKTPATATAVMAQVLTESTISSFHYIITIILVTKVLQLLTTNAECIYHDQIDDQMLRRLNGRPDSLAT